ncbi:MAG: asparagine synthase (glutamine-hydrolyzing), partial [Thermomicrobiales bacterium]
MCGLAGIIGLNGQTVDVTALERMAFSLQHRGPDDKGIYVNGAVGFGFRRLSILDLSPGGHQPKVSRDEKVAIVFNGEIYNYIELRAELTALGHTFESSGDTEVLLAAYREWGSECLPKLNGMWAFLIYDLAEQKVFGSRDRFGVKPLYRHTTGDLVLFGSEIKAILESGYYQTRLNWNVATAFLLRNQLDVDGQTFYEGIEQVPAGSAFELYLDGRHRSWSFWSLDEIEPTQVQEPIETFKHLFDDAVRLRMRSDVPVGVCLSGGLDSTSILCRMAKRKSASGHQLQAFSYMSKEYDESRYIADTIQWTGAQLNRLEVDPVL